MSHCYRINSRWPRLLQQRELLDCLLWIPRNLESLQSWSTNFSISLYLNVSSLWHCKQTAQKVCHFMKRNLQSVRSLTASPLWLKNLYRFIKKFKEIWDWYFCFLPLSLIRFVWIGLNFWYALPYFSYFKSLSYLGLWFDINTELNPSDTFSRLLKC